MVAVSVALTTWVRTRPGFDPYGWLTWGHMTLHGGLNTNAAPSWKPLPYVFTVLYAFAGRGGELWLWMVTATAVSLGGLVVAGRLAYRLTGAPDGRRWAGWAAGTFAAVSMLGLHDELRDTYLHYILSAQSDPMIVAFVLGAVECQLSGRPRAAFGLLGLAALGRPEVWPVLAVDMVWLWRRRPDARWMLVAGVVVIALLWFGIPALTSRSWFVAGDNAVGSGRAPTGDRLTGTLHRFVSQNPWPLQLAAVLGVALAAWRRDRVVLALAGAVLVWMVVEVAFALHGWPGLGRYMFEATAVQIVIAATFVGRLLAGDLLGGRSGASWAGPVVVAALVAGLISPELSQARIEHRDLIAQSRRTRELDDLVTVVRRLGGAARIRACGEALIPLEDQTALAYTVGENVNRIGFKYPQPGHPTNPIILFTPDRSGTGWTVRAMRQTRPGCVSLPAGG